MKQLYRTVFFFVVLIGWSTHSAASLVEAEEAFVDAICGNEECDSKTLAKSLSREVAYEKFPDEKKRLISAAHQFLCSHKEMDESLQGICQFASEVSVGMSPSIQKVTACRIDYSHRGIPKPLAVKPDINLPEILGCTIWAGLMNQIDPNKQEPVCSEREFSLLMTLVELTEDLRNIVLKMEKELSSEHRRILSHALSIRSQKDWYEINTRLVDCNF